MAESCFSSEIVAVYNSSFCSLTFFLCQFPDNPVQAQVAHGDLVAGYPVKSMSDLISKSEREFLNFTCTSCDATFQMGNYCVQCANPMHTPSKRNYGSVDFPPCQIIGCKVMMSVVQCFICYMWLCRQHTISEKRVGETVYGICEQCFYQNPDQRSRCRCVVFVTVVCLLALLIGAYFLFGCRPCGF